MRIIITGGGTGGHIYPALAVAEALRGKDGSVELLYIGGEGGLEAQIVPATGIPFRAVASRKLRKLLSPSTVPVLLALWQGYRQARAILKEFGPDVVVSTGGYVAAATAMAAARQGRPTVIQEYNAIPGRTNKWLARWATRICVWFEETAAELPADKIDYTGVPIRSDVVSGETPAAARSALSLDEDRFTVLIVGGSQGARRLNQLALGAATKVDGVQILHQTGARNYEGVAAEAKGMGLAAERYRMRPFLEHGEIPLAYRAADIVICRCGAATLAEVAANGLPALLVPLPTAYANHQTANARAYSRGGAGILLPEAELTSERLASEIEKLRDDPSARDRMSTAARAIAKPEAASSVAEIARRVISDQ